MLQLLYWWKYTFSSITSTLFQLMCQWCRGVPHPPYLWYISAYLVISGNYEGSRNCSEYLTQGLGLLGVDIFYLLSDIINIWCRVSLVGKMNYKSDSGLKTTKHHRNHFNPFSIEGSCLLCLQSPDDILSSVTEM